MKFNKWTLGLAAVGVVSLTSAARADESKPSALQTALSNTTISGYVSASANVGLTKDYDTSPAGAIPFDGGSKLNGFNLDVVKLSIAKPEDSTPWASGYEVDLLFGPDEVGYNNTAEAPGGNHSFNSDAGIKQAFVTLNAPIGNGLDFKVGVFDSPLGYEVFDSGSNPNYTHSWGYDLEPTELTGAQASYKVNDIISLNGGVADTWSAGIDNRDYNEGATASVWHKTGFGDVTLTAPSSWGWAAGSTFFAGVLYGDVSGVSTYGNHITGDDNFYQGGYQVNYYGGLTLNTPWKPLTGGVAFDYVQNAESLGDAGENVFAIGLYGTYKATDKLSFDARGEYVEGDPGADKFSGSQNLAELTGTIEYDLWANVQTRVEARWDKNLSASEGTLFGGTETGAVGLYANIIYKF